MQKLPHIEVSEICNQLGEGSSKKYKTSFWGQYSSVMANRIFKKKILS